MTRAAHVGLRARLVLTALLGTVLGVAALVTAFNLALDSRLRTDLDNLLRDRAAAQLRTISIVDGRLRIPEAPDQGAPDSKTWIFSGNTPLEQPAAAGDLNAAAQALAGRPRRFVTVGASHTRLYAVPITESSRPLGTLVVGASLTAYEHTVSTALIASSILGALIVLGVAALSWWLIRRALAPVAQMTATAAEWGEHDLSQRFLAGEPHDELSSLAATFDGLLDRISRSLARERQLTAEVSHELRTPLAGIIAESELALSRERTPERYRQALESIHRSAVHLTRSLDALLVAARARPGDPASASDPLDVARRAAREASASNTQGEVTIDVEQATPRLRVGAGSEVVERALAPIVENAARHARQRVSIVLRGKDREVLFEVSDDGPGVHAQVRERMFEPGVSRGSDDTRGSGAGLGLALARRLARAAGGDVEYTGDGRTAHFTLRLPAA